MTTTRAEILQDIDDTLSSAGEKEITASDLRRIFTAMVKAGFEQLDSIVNPPPGNNTPGLTVDESQAIGLVGSVTNSGTWSDADGDVVALSASIGSVTRNPDGTWDWALDASTSHNNTTVTITADDGTDQTQVQFVVYVVSAANATIPLSQLSELTKEVDLVPLTTGGLSFSHVSTSGFGSTQVVTTTAPTSPPVLASADLTFTPDRETGDVAVTYKVARGTVEATGVITFRVADPYAPDASVFPAAPALPFNPADVTEMFSFEGLDITQTVAFQAFADGSDDNFDGDSTYRWGDNAQEEFMIFDKTNAKSGIRASRGGGVNLRRYHGQANHRTILGPWDGNGGFATGRYLELNETYHFRLRFEVNSGMDWSKIQWLNIFEIYGALDNGEPGGRVFELQLDGDATGGPVIYARQRGDSRPTQSLPLETQITESFALGSIEGVYTIDIEFNADYNDGGTGYTKVWISKNGAAPTLMMDVPVGTKTAYNSEVSSIKVSGIPYIMENYTTGPQPRSAFASANTGSGRLAGDVRSDWFVGQKIALLGPDGAGAANGEDLGAKITEATIEALAYIAIDDETAIDWDVTAVTVPSAIGDARDVDVTWKQASWWKANNVANSIYVDTAGDDGNAGTTPAAPVATIAKALALKGADSSITHIRLKGGQTHNVQVILDTLDDLVIEAYGGGGAWVVDGTGLTLSAVPNSHMGLIDVRDCKRVRIRGGIIQDSSHSGVAVRNETGASRTDDVVIEACLVDRTQTYGIIAIGQGTNLASSSTVHNVAVQHCGIKDACLLVETAGIGNAGGEALTARLADGILFGWNRIWQHHKEGIDCKGVDNYEIVGNLVHNQFDGAYRADGRGTGIYADGADNGNLTGSIHHNIVLDDVNGITVASESGGTSSGLAVYNNHAEGCLRNEFALTGCCFGNNGIKENVDVYNNSFVSRGGNQFVVNVTEAEPAKLVNYQLRNNLVCRTVASVTALINHASAATSFDYNALWNAGGSLGATVGSNTVTTDPKLVQRDVHDFWDESVDVPWTRPVVTILAPAVGSPLFGASTLILATDDFNGFARPVAGDQSIGAFEGPVYDAGRKTDAGATVYTLATVQGSQATNASGDLDNQSPTGDWMMLFDDDTMTNLGVNLSTFEVNEKIPYGWTGGTAAEFPMWHPIEDKLWIPSSTELQLVDMEGNVSTTVALPAITTVPGGDPVTANQWRTGTAGPTTGFVWTVTQPGPVFDTGHTFIQPFDLTTGTLIGSGFWINDLDATQSRLHNPHPGSTRLFFFSKPDSATPLHIVNFDGSGYQALTPPVGATPQFIHPTIYGDTLAWSDDDKCYIYDYSNPSSPVEIRTIDITAAIGGGTYTQWLHGVLRPDGVMLFVASQAGSAIGIYKTDVNNPSAPIERVIDLNTPVPSGGFDWSPRPAGRNWVSWNEGTSKADRQVYFSQV